MEDTTTNDATPDNTEAARPQGDPATQNTPAPDQNAAPQGDTDWKAEAEKLKAESRKWETRAKENRGKAQEYDALKQAEMTDLDRANATAQEVTQRAEAAETRVALLQAAVDHGLSKDDLDLLDGIPADQVADRAAKLAARIGTATPPAGASGNPVGGGQANDKPEMDPGTIAAQAANRKPRVHLFQ